MFEITGKQGVFFVLVLFFIASGLPLFAQTSMDRGIEAYRWNKPEEAKVHFEAALGKDRKNEDVYYYLGLVYEQLHNNAKAIETLRNGLLISVLKKHIFYYHIGNNYYALKDYTLAEKNYSLCIAEDSLFPHAYLGRAQSKLNLGLFKEAVEDYKVYLRLDPETPQRVQIEKLIAMLEGDIEGQEKMIQGLLDSIKNASTDTQTESAGTEDFKDTGTEDIDILD
ncbi:MAG: tetratricopeptide repeat protein [Spirochaetales bacterium]|nr:tetratricopeptide repeat protein [Spirochaetales bacterium]